jgi:hypothetical protein
MGLVVHGESSIWRWRVRKGHLQGRLWVNKQQYWDVREHAFGEKKLNQGDGFWRMERKNSRCGGIAVAIRDEFHL